MHMHINKQCNKLKKILSIRRVTLYLAYGAFFRSRTEYMVCEVQQQRKLHFPWLENIKYYKTVSAECETTFLKYFKTKTAEWKNHCKSTFLLP